MGRELRRVPLEFDYPQKEVWYGFYLGVQTCMGEKHCLQCKEMAKIKGIPMTSYGCPDFEEYIKEPLGKLKELLDPPTGEGYQLWETTSEGSPSSPVFASLDDLCEWCEKNATTFGSYTATKEEWKQMLTENFVYHKKGGVVFL